MSSKNRIDWIDVAKGVAIVLMIIGHTIPHSNLLTFIFSFHMPLFVILSGITYKTIKNKSELKKNLIKYLKKLFLPYALTLFFCIAIDVFKNSENLNVMIFLKEVVKGFIWGNGCNYMFLGKNFTGVGPIWFLITLFFSKIIFDIINLYFNQRKHGEIDKIVVYSFLLLTGILIGSISWLPQGLDLSLIFLFYLYFGSLFNNIMKKIKVNESLYFIVVFIIWGICLGLGINIELAVRSYPYGILCVLESLCASYCVIELCKLICSNNLIKKIFSNIGFISLTILCVHTFDMQLVDWKNLGINLYIISFVRVAVDLLVAFAFAGLKNKIKHYIHKIIPA